MFKIGSTRQNESGSLFVFQNGALEVYKPNFHAKWCNELTSKNALSNRSLFHNFETTTKFVVSK